MILQRVCHGLFAALATLITWSLLTLKAVTGVVLTATVIMVPGTKGPNGVNIATEFVDSLFEHVLQGWVCSQASDGMTVNNYPRAMGSLTGESDPLFDDSVGVGLSNMETLIADNQTTGAVTFGYSQGAAVATRWLREHANGNNSDAPAADKTSFVLIGNPNRPNGGLLARMPGLYVPGMGVTFNGATPESQYKVTDVVRQYDLFGDFPIDLLNVFSVLNVLADAGTIHGNYINVDVNDPRNWTEQHGNTTYIMEYAEHLPLLRPLYAMAAAQGMTQTPLLDAVEPVLRYLVELGYDRTNQSTASTFQPGSSVVRFLQTLPEFGQAIQQGLDILQAGLHESTVQSVTKQNRSEQLSVGRVSKSSSVVTVEQSPSRKTNVPSSASSRTERTERHVARHANATHTNR